MGYNNIQHGLANTGVYSSPGAERIIFAAAEDVRGYSVVSGDTVTAISLAPGRQYHLFDNLDDLAYGLTTTSTKSGKLYQLDVSFTVAVETGQKNTLFDQLADTELVAVLQDNNFQWWLLGHEQPLRVISNEARVDNDTNGYTVKLSGKQRELPYHMADSWIQAIGSLPFSTLLDPVDGTLNPVTIQPTSPGSNGSLPTPTAGVSNVKVAPADGYIVEPQIDFVLALGGRTVKLPLNPQEGKLYTIKDLNGVASFLPIVVDGNGRVIDQNLTARIETSEGSLSLVYAASKWNICAFVN